MIVAAVAGTSCQIALAQTATRIAGHEMGETIQQWAVIEGVSDRLRFSCQGGRRRDSYQERYCQHLTDIQNGTAKVSGSLKGSASDSRDREYLWGFTDGILSEVGVTPLASSSTGYRDEIDFLVQAYGFPSSTRTVPYQNAYGGHWECSEAFWTLANGTQITALENTEFAKQGQLLAVNFLSKDAAQKQSPKPKANPYESTSKRRDDIGSHQIGESFAEWLIRIRINLDDLCRQNRAACKTLKKLRDDGNGIFFTYDSSERTFRWEFTDGKLSDVEITPRTRSFLPEIR